MTPLYNEQRKSTVIRLFSILVFLALAWNVFSGIMIAQYLDKRGIPMNFRLLRYRVFGYAQKYKEFTIEETGRPGPLYMSFFVSLIVFVSLFFFTLILLKSYL